MFGGAHAARPSHLSASSPITARLNSQLGGTPWSAHPSNTLLLCILYFVFVVVGLYFFRLSVYYWSSRLPIRRHSMIGSSLKYIALLYFVFVGVLYLFLNMCISDLLLHQLVGTSRWTHSSKPPACVLVSWLLWRENTAAAFLPFLLPVQSRNTNHPTFLRRTFLPSTFLQFFWRCRLVGTLQSQRLESSVFKKPALVDSHVFSICLWKSLFFLGFVRHFDRQSGLCSGNTAPEHIALGGFSGPASFDLSQWN